MTPRADLVILGGGPAGLAAAFYAHRAGIPFLLLERSAELGGLCRTFCHGEHRYDSGAHRFHDHDAEVTRDLRALLGDELAEVDAPSAILDRGRFVRFPPSPLNWLFAYGPLEGVRAGAELLRARRAKRPERNFEDFAVNRYGARFARPLLLDYSEKLWGLPARELSPEVATRRLSGLSLATLFVELLLPHRRAAHLDGSFLYPRSGYGEIVRRVELELPRERLLREHEVTGLDCAAGRVARIRLAGRPALEVAGTILSTLPLTLLVRMLGDELPASVKAAAQRLRFRHVRIVFLRVALARVTTNASIYLPDPALCISRVYEPKNRSPRMAPANETSLVAEVPCGSDDALSTLAPEALAERVIRELASTGLLHAERVVEWRHHFLPNAYPVYGLDYPQSVRIIREALGSIANLELHGRSGLFRYGHLHDQFRMAKDFVASFAGRRRSEPAAPQDLGAHPEVGEEAPVRTHAS
ncbi:MAG: FAD-dependent oxidoreductase [Candidatus Binatia bacterium]